MIFDNTSNGSGIFTEETNSSAVGIFTLDSNSSTEGTLPRNWSIILSILST